MRGYKSLSHTRWDCKYHVVFIPKKRQRLIYGALRKHLGSTFHELAKRKGVTIEEG
ncbi:transposase, partial [Vibrio alginolyticus]|nr:transposase [Vibrio alginolyticus]